MQAPIIINSGLHMCTPQVHKIYSLSSTIVLSLDASV